MSLKAQFGRLKWSLMSEKKKQKLLDEACQLLRFWPETNGLLELAKTQNVGLRFDEALNGSDTDGYLHRNRATGECFIALKPGLKAGDLAIPLIHELRHLWQEQQLGLTPATSGLAEKDAATALLITRAKEADAFAFTNLMISRINNAQRDYADSAAMTPEEQEIFIGDRLAARLPAEKQKMAEDFKRELKDLDSYDGIALRTYYRRYIDPIAPLKHMTEKQGHVLDIVDVRRILITGTAEGMPPYLDDVDDKTLSELILSGAKPDARETARLIDAFETASAARAPANAWEKRQEIETRIRRFPAA